MIAIEQRPVPVVFHVGSRCAVYEAAVARGMRFAGIAAPVGSPLHQHLTAAGTPFLSLQDKAQLIDAIRQTDFDLLISNGCPHILPVSTLQREGQRFINIHPSLLPNLKGRHPVNGAVLFSQPLGASCHLMDDGIDTGPVIARVHVDADAGADLGLLYRLAFLAERDAFQKACDRGFVPCDDELRDLATGDLYFSRTERSMEIHFEDPVGLTVRRVSAFSVAGQLARFRHRGLSFRVWRAAPVLSRYMRRTFRDAGYGTIVLRYDDSLVVKLRDGFLRLSGVHGEAALPQEGECLLQAHSDKEAVQA